MIVNRNYEPGNRYLLKKYLPVKIYVLWDLIVATKPTVVITADASHMRKCVVTAVARN